MEIYGYGHIRKILDKKKPTEITAEEKQKIQKYVKHKEEIIRNPDIEIDEKDRKWFNRAKGILERIKYEQRKKVKA